MRAAGNLDSTQRQLFLQTLVDRPGLLEPLPPSKFLWLYRAFRMGATDEALAVFGVWGSQRASVACEMPDYVAQVGIDNELRKACRQLAICVTQEVPEQRLQLRDEYLQLDDGTCCLPVAYTLGYGYQSLGKINEWIELLDARLSDQAVTGDKRVNWLIARAHADEIKQGSTEPFAEPTERVMDGRGWLDEAQLMAESPATKVRIAKEVAARLAAVQQFDAARQVLQQAGTNVPAELSAQIAGWKTSVDAFEAAHASQRDKQSANAQASYVETLRKRRDAATARGDNQAAGRYNALINQASDR